MSNNAPFERLSEIFNRICDVALQVHEQFEHEGCCPLLEFEQAILGNSRRFDDTVRATTIWAMLLFTQPRIASQKKFQDAVSVKLSDPDAATVIRHLMCAAPRAWSFRHSYQRSFAHTVAGPNAHSELTVHGCLSSRGPVREEEHLFLIGWMLTFDDRFYLIQAGELSKQQIYQIEKTKPFPMQLSEEDFWEENMFGIMQDLYDTLPVLAVGTPATPVYTDYSPERRFERLTKIITSSLSSGSIRASASIQIIAATKQPNEILSAVDALVATYASNEKDARILMDLRARTLEAIGCDATGNMPHAHSSLLTSDPVALLLLPETLDMFKEIGPRDSIRMALNYDETHGTSDAINAFEIYQRERRWLAAFPCIDMASEEHAAKFGIPIEAIEQIFAPQLFKSVLPMTPQGEVLKILQNKYGFYLPDTQPPTFKMVIDAIRNKSFQKSGNMAAIAQWIMSCCDRWRYCLCEIEPDTATRTINQSNQKLLRKGLKNLSAMFKK